MGVRRAWPPMMKARLERRVARREMEMEGRGQRGIVYALLNAEGGCICCMWRLVLEYVVRKSKIAEWLYTEMKLDWKVGAARLSCLIVLLHLHYCQAMP